VQSGQFVLTGTTLAGDRSIAFLKEVAGGKARTVRKGDKINGMLVAEVLPDRVRFTQGGESEELMLKVSPGPKTTVAAAPNAEAAAPAPRGGAGAAARRAAAAAAARGAAVGEGQPPPGAPQTGRGARAAAKAAAKDAEATSAAGESTAPAGTTPADAWGQVYQRMQRGNARTK
jgi:pyruvate dehydrogenase E2 component (dihydrolipoamide acetyltransferase)